MIDLSANSFGETHKRREGKEKREVDADNHATRDAGPAPEVIRLRKLCPRIGFISGAAFQLVVMLINYYTIGISNGTTLDVLTIVALWSAVALLASGRLLKVLDKCTTTLTAEHAMGLKRRTLFSAMSGVLSSWVLSELQAMFGSKSVIFVMCLLVGVAERQRRSHGRLSKQLEGE